MVPVVKVFKLVLRHIFDLAFLGRHQLFQILTAFGMVFRLVESHHVGKVGLFTVIVAKDIGKHRNQATGQVALALQNLVEHRRIEPGAIGNVAMAKTPIALMALFIGVTQEFTVVQIFKKIHHIQNPIKRTERRMLPVTNIINISPKSLHLDKNLCPHF